MKPVHRGKLIRSDGAVVALCAWALGSNRVIDLRRATWTNRDGAVTCKRCRKLMAFLAATGGCGVTTAGPIPPGTPAGRAAPPPRKP